MNADLTILHRLQDEVLESLTMLDAASQRSDHGDYLDRTTCLPNKRCFERTLRRHLHTTSLPTGLLLIDIDHLKLINDTKGRSVGDKVLAEVAARLDQVGGNTAAFRLNGDEYALVVFSCRGQQHLDALAQDVLSATSVPLSGFLDVLPRVTIGGALIGSVFLDPSALRRQANIALCQAKDARRGGYVAFDRGSHATSTRHVRNLRRLEAALLSDALVPHYQPVVNIVTNRMVGVEALARIVGDDGQVVVAEDFHSALQDPSVSVRVTDCMLRHAARDLRGWLDRGLPVEHVGINLSSTDLANSDLPRRLERIFGEQDVPLSHLVLEVTETVYLDGNGHEIAARIGGLREQGLLVALDDFGTGYASLKHLRDFPVDIVKIDRSFVHNLPADRSSAAIVEGLAGIADRMGMKVVVEGIETAEQAAFLRDIGCTLGQGYLFGRPAPAASLPGMLSNSNYDETDSNRTNRRVNVPDESYA